VGQRTFTFRLTSEGLQEFQRDITSLGDAGDAAFKKLTGASPELASAIDRAAEAVKRARTEIASAADGTVKLGGILDAGGKAAGRYGAAHGEAGGKIQDFRELIRLASDAAEGNVAGMTRSAALLANGFGLIGSTFSPVVAALVAGFALMSYAAGTWTSDTEKAEAAQKALNDAIQKGNELLLSQEQATQRAAVVKRGEAIASTQAALDLARAQSAAASERLSASGGQLSSTIASLQARPDAGSSAVQRDLQTTTAQLADLRKKAADARDAVDALESQLADLTDGRSAGAHRRDVIQEIADSQEHLIAINRQAAAQREEDLAGDQAVASAKEKLAKVGATLEPQEEAEIRRRSALAIQAKTEADQIAALNKAIDDQSKKQDEALDKTDRQADALRRQADVLGVDESQLRVLNQVMEAENALRAAGVDLETDEAKARLANVRAAAQELEARRAIVDAQKKAQAESDRVAKQSTDDIVRYTADRFADLWSNTKGGWKAVWDNVETTFKQMIARIAAEAIIRPIISPIVANATGATPAAGSGASGSLGGGGSGDMLQNLSSLGRQLGTKIFGQSADGGAITVEAGSALDASGSEGASLLESSIVEEGGSASAGAGAAGAGFSGFMGGVGAGFAAGSLLNSAVGGHEQQGQVGSAIGATAGAIIGSIIPVIGTFLGGVIGGALGGLVGGMFGPGPSVGPGGVALLGEQGGRLNVGYANGDNGFDPSIVRNAAQEVADAVNKLADTYKLTIDLNNPNMVQNSNALIAGPGALAPGSSDPHAATSQAGLVDNLITSRVLESSDPHVQAAINSSTAKDLEQNLQLVTSLIAVLKSVNDNGTIDPKPLTATEQILKAINDRFDLFKDKAADFAYSLGEVDDARQKALAAVTQGFNDAIADQISAMLDPFGRAMDALTKAQEERLEEAKAAGADLVQVEKLSGIERARVYAQFAQPVTNANDNIANYVRNLSFGNSSVLSPQSQAQLAASQFETQAQAALGGDFNAYQNITAYADTFLGTQRTLTGSGAATVDVYNRITDVLSRLVDQDPMQLLQQAQLAATHASNDLLGELRDRLDDIKSALAAIKNTPARLVA
jgi:hypothetical protein